MAVEVANQPAVGPVARIVAFVQGLPLAYHKTVEEMKRVTWPDREQIRQCRWESSSSRSALVP